jgi:hypothetical protein
MPSYRNDPIIVRTTQTSGSENYGGGVYGESNVFNGVRGVTYAPFHGATVGINEHVGAQPGPGVYGDSKGGVGVEGHSHTDAAGVVGINDFVSRARVFGGAAAVGGPGVYGESKQGPGVRGVAGGSPGGSFESKTAEGVRGFSNSTDAKKPKYAGVSGIGGEHGVGVYGKGGRLAAYFDGDVEVRGDIRFVNADCAEDFDLAEAAEPGTVMVLGEAGALRQSQQAYDKRVAGVISGAGSYKPGLILDKHESQTTRVPIGLMGKVYCKVDAQSSPIEIGDLLTTSATPGHAMKASDPFKAFGSVIGKALEALHEGQGLIPILIALQ